MTGRDQRELARSGWRKGGWLAEDVVGEIEAADDLTEDAGLDVVAFVVGDGTGATLAVDVGVLDHAVGAFPTVLVELKPGIVCAQDAENVVGFLGFRQGQAGRVGISGGGQLSSPAC